MDQQQLSSNDRFRCFTLIQDFVFEDNTRLLETNAGLLDLLSQVQTENQALNEANISLQRQLNARIHQLNAANDTLATINDFAVAQTLLVASLQARLHAVDDRARSRRIRRRLEEETTDSDSQTTIVISSDEDSDDSHPSLAPFYPIEDGDITP